jgi:pimeloyl-ACP methyl ester carboxylesterase
MTRSGNFRILNLIAVCIGVLLSSSSCSKQSLTAPGLTSAGAQREALAAARRIEPGTTLEGDIGPGAHYVVSMPSVWNGDLVLYAHGFTAPIFPVGIPPGEEPLVEGLRQLALQGGFAFAYSSYSQTGLGLRDAAQRTQQLEELFVSVARQPGRTFLIGTSFGALAAVKLAETYPDRYAGVMTLCGMIGGTRAEVDYVSHVRVLFDVLYPGVLRGSLYELPTDFDITKDVVIPVSTAIQANPQPAIILSQITQTPIPFTNGNGEELIRSIIQALVLQAVELSDLLERTHGQSFFDNRNTVYSGNLPAEVLADLNARVARYSADPAALQFLAQNYQPKGTVTVPLVSLHTSLDPVVPVFHEDLYRALATASGHEDALHQVIVNRYGHCNFMPVEIGAGFVQMVTLAASAKAHEERTAGK